MLRSLNLALHFRQNQVGVADREAKEKNVLVLGSGYVAEPLVEYLVRDEKVGVVLGKYT